MRIASFSDCHWQYENISDFPKADILLFAGDWSGMGTDAEAYDFAEWMSRLPYGRKIAIPGNHERFVERFPSEATRMFSDRGIRLLIDDMETVDGIRIYGTPWCPLFGDGRWAFLESENRLYDRFSAIPKGTDILITHCPPHGTLDDGWGSTALASVLAERNPRIHTFGHIHEAYGHQGRSYNVSVLDYDYVLSNPLTVMEI